MSIVLLAAVLAVTAVSVAERIEVELTDATVAEVPSSPDPVVAPSSAPASDAPLLTSAVLPSGAMALTLSDGAATITTGVESTAIELATTAIGDLELADLADDVVIAQADGEVSYDWGDVTEWYRTVPEGIEHGYTIDAPLSDADELTVTVAVADGTPTLVDADAVSIERPGASALWYRGLIAYDAEGTDVPAAMDVVNGAIELQVDTADAVYPITIDPVIADAQVVRATPVTPGVDTVPAGNLLGGIEAAAPCPTGTLLTGLTVYQSPFTWVRAAVPRCRQVLSDGGTVALGAIVVTGPDFGDPTGFVGQQTADCALGSAVTGFTGNIGDLVDNVSLRCSVLNADGTVGAGPVQLPPIGGIGGVPLVSPVTCTNAFANGLQGRRGDDIDALGLQCATVSVVDDSAGDRLGYAVDVDGNRMVASAPFADEGGVAEAGKVFVYDRADAGSPWTLSDTLTMPALESAAGFGDSVSVRGDLIAVGESDRLGDEAEAGRVWVFSYDGFVWEQLGAVLQQPFPTIGDRFGADVEWVTDTVLAIGAPGAVADTGNVFIAQYDIVGGTWSYSDLATVLAGFGAAPETGDEFGYAIGYDDSADGIGALIVGAPGFDLSFPSEVDNGAVYRFFGTGASFVWNSSTAYLPGRRMGTATAVAGNRYVSGGYGSGALEVDSFVFAGTWTGTGSGFVTGEVPGVGDGPVNDYLALDGGLMAVGRGGNGGGVSVYTIGGTWPAGPAIDVEPTGREAGDRIGWSLALGNAVLTVGAPGDDGATNEVPDSGAVYSIRVPVTATFIDLAPFASWEDPTNWDTGVVPGAGDAAVVPVGAYPELGELASSTVDTLRVDGQLRIRGDLRVETQTTIVAGATVDLQSTATFDPSGDVTLDGLLNNAGPVVIDGAGTINGAGRFVNDNEVRKTGAGTLTLGPDVVWTSRFYSELNVTGGAVVIQGPLLDENPSAVLPNPTSDDVTAGTFRVAAGTSLTFDGDLIVGPGTRFVTEITGDDSSPENYGRIIADRLGFDRIVPNPGSGLVGFQANVTYDFDASDVYPIITCAADCAPDIGEGGDVVLSVEFDQLALSGLTPVQTRLGIDLATVANKVVAPDPGVGFGTDVSVDGDWAVVGSRGVGQPRVYEFVAGEWLERQSLTGSSAENVAIDGNTIFADGIRFRRLTPGAPFVADQTIGGTTFDVNGRLFVRGEGDGTAVVRLVAGAVDEPLVPSVANPSFGADVAIVDLGGGEAIAAVSAPAAGRVYLFDLAVDEGLDTVSATPRGFVSGATGFGRSIALSEGRLVVGDPFDGIPVAGAGAARVYERVGPGATYDGDPVKLQASNADVSDTFGDDVAIDGDVIVVGAPIAQKFAFPLRDGAAYVFQYNDADWIETDILRADDGFQEELFGDVVAVSGNRVLVGAPNDVNDNGPAAGAFYFYVTAPPVSVIPPSGLSVDITASNSSTEVGVAAIDISSLPASVFQGYGGPTATYAKSDLQTIDLRTDTLESTPVADVTLADLALDSAPVTRDLLGTILLSDIPLDGGWSAKLRPNGPPIVEQTVTLLDVHDADRFPGVLDGFPGVLDDIRLGDLGLRASNLGSISTYAALLAGVPVTQLPVPQSSTDANAFWCDLVERNGLDCTDDFGPAPLTLPVLSFAGIDVEQAEFLGALIDGETNLDGTPIGSTRLGALNIGAVPLASQPLVPSKSLPSYLPSTLEVPDAFRSVTLGELGQAAPLGAVTPEDVGLASDDPVSVLDIEHQPDSPLADYSWVAPAVGASLLVGSEAPLASSVAGIPIGDLGLNAPVLSVPLDEIVLPNGRKLGDYRLVELLGGEAEFGAAPFAASPFAASPFGSAPFAASSIGASPFRASPFRASPFRASPFRASPFAASTFGVSPFRASPFRASPFRASPFAASPFRASEFGTSPFGASPFRASPFRASPLDSSPFRASPFRASPLSELGLSAPITAIPLDGLVGPQSLGSYRLADLDPSNLLFGLPLEPFVGWVDENDDAVFDCNVIDCRQPNGFTLGEGIEAGALPVDLAIADVQPGLFGLSLADLVGAHPDLTADNLRTFISAINITLGDAADAGFAPDGIPIELFSAYDQVTISDERLLFSGWRLVDFAGLATGLDLAELETAFEAWASADPLMVGELTQKIPVAQDGLAEGELWVDTLALSTLVDAAPDLTIGDIWPLLRPLRVEHLRTPGDQPLTLVGAAVDTTIDSILDGDPAYPQPSRLEGLLWGDIVGSAGTEPVPSAATFTVADVIGGFTGVTLGEFLRAAQPITDQRTEQIDLSAIDLAEYATGTNVSFDVDVRVTGGNRPQSARIVVNLPDGARYVPGSARLEDFELDENELVELEPATFGDSLVWQIANLLPDTTYTLRFDTRSSERLGTLATAASAQLASADLYALDSTSVEYREALEPNDTPVQADSKDPILTGQIVLSQISSATDVDIYSFEVDQAGQRIGGVLWNLPADYDLTIIGPGTEPLSPTEGRIRESVDDLDSPILGGALSSTLSDGGQYQPPPGWSVIARSTSRGTAPETVAPVPTYVSGTYYLVVSSYNGALSDSPYALRLLSNAPVVAPPVCTTPTDFPFDDEQRSAPSLAPLPNDVNTLFVVNHDRLARQYGDAQADRVLAEIGDLAAELGGDLDDLGLVSGMIDLGRGNPGLTTEYEAWDETPCDLALANGVVRETIDVLRGVYAANPDIENVVIVGSDRIIPFARIADRTLIGNEQSYAGTFGGDPSSPLYAALQAGTYFSDDPFVDPTPTLVNDRALYVAEKSVGRLVENPDEIIGQLTSFVQQGGAIRVDSAVVSGYDFLTDSSEEIAELLDGPVTGPVDRELIREDWEADDLAAKVFTENTPGIGVINGHFSHQGTQSAFGSASGDEDDALFVDAIGDSDFTGSLLFTVGCHSGLSAAEFVPGALGASWAESLAAAGASAYVAQSGFGYGSTDSIQLTERLLSVFASRLDGNFTIGEALRFAKNEYVAPLSAISVYDEKSLQQAILYGLPFSRPGVVAPPERPGPPPLLQLVDSDVPGLRTATLSSTFDIQRAERPRGTVFEIDGQSYAPSGKPLQPVASIDATGPMSGGVPPERLHGALLLGGTAYNAAAGPIDPVYNTPTVNRGAVEPEIQPIDAIYPISPLGVSDALTEFGRRDFVTVQPGRFTATQPDGTGDQVLYDDLSIQTLHSASDDWVAPTVTSANQVVVDGALSVTVSTPDTDVAGVVVAVVENLAAATVAEPARWRTFALADAGEGRWSGGVTLLSSCTEQLEYLVQVYDRAGNVRVMSNKAAGFVSSCDDDVAPPQDPALQAVPLAANLDASGWFVGPVTIDIDSTLAGPFSYRIDGGPPVAIPTGTPRFVIDGNGIRTYEVSAAGSALAAVGVVRIDADSSSPSISITSPAGDVVAGAIFTVAFSCQDPSLVLCAGTLTDSSGDEMPVASGDQVTAVAGSYVLTVTADDAISTTGPSVATRSFTGRAADVTPPTITCPSTASYLLNQAGATMTVTVTDAGSGPTVPTITSPVATGSVGTRSIRFEAVDQAGNGAVQDCGYTVGYRFGGFRPPLSGTAINQVKAGSTVPVKWRITDANGVGVANRASFTGLRLVPSPCTPGAPVSSVGVLEITDTSALKYLGNGNWQHNWKSAKTLRGCFDLQLRLADTNTPRVAELKLR